MTNKTVSKVFQKLSTPLVADACLRLKVPYRVALSGIMPVVPKQKVAGQALPAKHYGSVDIFLEAMTTAHAGDILVIDNGCRKDEACIGDLTALEARASGLAALVVWGCHRDTADLLKIGFPVFSYGTCPSGPQRLDSREDNALSKIQFGSFEVTKEDFVFADDDGVVFVPSRHLEDVLPAAEAIWKTERRQAQAIKKGKTLRQQLRFDEYLAKRSIDPSYSFRRHLRERGGAIEE
ncbi:MAG: RraA family protein [Ignavibacteriales bacterium]|nr:RraA family protein [Ignavibacteriales bacterium]